MTWPEKLREKDVVVNRFVERVGLLVGTTSFKDNWHTFRDELRQILEGLYDAVATPAVEGPPEEIGTGLYRMADGEIVGNEPEPQQF